MKKIILCLICVCAACSTFAANVERDVQICNIVTQYLCLLEDLQGQGYQRARKELEENLNTRGLQPETRRLVRRLSDACDLAESTLQNLGYTAEDSSDNSAVMWGESLGASGAAALIIGDPTPLIIGVGNAIIKQSKLDKEKRRAIDIQMRTFNQMLNRYHMEVNERRNDLVEEHNVLDSRFIRRSVYKEFLIASSKDGAEGINTLRKITLEYPHFREAWFFYGKKLFEQKKYAESIEAFQKVVDTQILVVRQDGLKGKAIAEIGVCKIYENKFKEALEFLEQAKKLIPSYDRVHYFMAWAYYYLQHTKKALYYIDSAINLNDLAIYLRFKVIIMLKLNYSEMEILQTIDRILQKGYGPEFLFSLQEIKKFMKREQSVDRFIPYLTARLEYGLFRDDVVLTNHNTYALTNIKVKVNIYGKYSDFKTNDGIVEESYTISRIAPKDSYKLSNIFSIANDGAADVVIEFSCDQSLASWKWSSADRKFIRISTPLVKDDVEAVEQGNAEAQFNLGWNYEHGKGVDRDNEEAVKWYRKSADQGHAEAQFRLGLCYYYGTGVTKDYTHAKKLISKAAEQGNVQAKNALKILWQ